MTYENIREGVFIKRPNRFIAQILVDGSLTVAHVKNTGRCRELLIPGVRVILQFHPDAAVIGRKTSFSLISVYKKIQGREVLINIDSQAPNQAAKEWLERSPFPGKMISQIRREVTYGRSRFDLAFTIDGRQAFLEVKGVTLEHDGIARFPDAPTERGVKHLMELAKAAHHGFEAYVLFVIQMKGCKQFRPNMSTHPAFGYALQSAADLGVTVLACDCLVSPEQLLIDEPVPVCLDLPELI